MASRDSKAEEAYREASTLIEHARIYGDTDLNLSELGLTEPPESLGNLTQLRELYLHKNRLTQLSKSLCNLTALKNLSLRQNQLADLPEYLGKLTALEGLDLSRNRLKALPEVPINFPALKELFLGNNRLTALPKSPIHLPALRLLSLGTNQLAMLPESVGSFTALESLYLDNNRLAGLPKSLDNLKALKELYLHGNPSLGLPAEVLGPMWQEVRDKKAKPANPAAILDYYFNRKKNAEASASTANREARSRFRFSESAEVLLQSALSLAQDSGRENVTSSCLLFAFAEAPDRTSLFVHDVLHRTGKYREAFADFMKDSGRRSEQASFLAEDPLQRISENFRGIVESAESIARRTTGEETAIHPRHLLAALLIGGSGSPVALRRLVKLEIHMPEFCHEFRQFIRKNWSDDNPEEWDSILIPDAPRTSAMSSAEPEISSSAKTDVPPQEPPSPEPRTLRRFRANTEVHSEGATPEILGAAQKCSEALRLFLTNPNTGAPLTVSIEGAWGSGKSSVMLNLREGLEHPPSGPRLRTVWFNPWKFDAGKALWAAFAVELERQLQPPDWQERMKARMKLMQMRMGWEEKVLVGLRIAAWAVLVLVLLYAVAAGVYSSNALKEQSLGLVAGVGVPLAVLGFARELLKQFSSPLRIDVKGLLSKAAPLEHADELHRFYEDFRRMLRVYVPPPKDEKEKHAVVVLIDDMDRCEAPKAVELMQSIHLLMNLDDATAGAENQKEEPMPGLIFVMGMDSEKVAAAVAAKHEKLLPFLNDGDGNASGAGLRFGRDYLEKFVHLTLHLPQMEGAGFEEYLEKLCGKVERQPEKAVAISPTEKPPQPGIATTPKPASPAREEKIPPPEPQKRPEETPEAVPKPQPEPTQKEIKAVIEEAERPELLQAVTRMVADALEHNPRRLKQFVNLFRLRCYLCAQFGCLETSVDEQPTEAAKLTLYQLAKLVAFDLAAPEVMARVRDGEISLEEGTVGFGTVGGVLAKLKDCKDRPELARLFSLKKLQLGIALLERQPEAADLPRGLELTEDALKAYLHFVAPDGK